MLAGILTSLRERCPKSDVVVLSGNPAETEALHGIRAIGRTSPMEVIHTLRQANLLICGGGSLLQDVTSARSLAYYLSVIWLAKKLGAKVMIYAQGIGPIVKKIDRRVSRSVLNRVDIISVRDAASKTYLEELGVDRQDIYLTADPSFAMEPDSPERADEILRGAGAPDGVPLIGVSLRPWKEQVNWLPAIARGLDTAATQIGGTLIFLPMQKDQDMGICVQVASQTSAKSVVVSDKLTPSETMAVIGRMSLIVGMRLHALIFAASMGIPFVGVAYDPKVEAFVSAADQGEPVGLEGVSAANLAERLADAWNNKEMLAKRAIESVRTLREAALENADLACALINP